MFGTKSLRRTGLITLFFFAFFMFASDFARAQQKEDDTLSQARKLYQKGDYESSIDVLVKFIDVKKSVLGQKKNVAEAYYLLAKNFFDIGDDAKVDENLRSAYETFPDFSKDEANLSFKDRMEKIKQEVVGRDTEEPSVQKETRKETRRVIEEPSQVKPKKKSSTWLIIGGVIVVGAIVAVLALGKKKTTTTTYDVRGTWIFTGAMHTGDSISDVYTFSGTLTSGTFRDSGNYTGTYTVSGKAIAYEYDSLNLKFTGEFSSQTTMGGIMQYVYSGDGLTHSGTWVARKNSAAAGMQNRSVSGIASVCSEK